MDSAVLTATAPTASASPASPERLRRRSTRCRSTRSPVSVTRRRSCSPDSTSRPRPNWFGGRWTRGSWTSLRNSTGPGPHGPPGRRHRGGGEARCCAARCGTPIRTSWDGRSRRWPSSWRSQLPGLHALHAPPSNGQPYAVFTPGLRRRREVAARRGTAGWHTCRHRSERRYPSARGRAGTRTAAPLAGDDTVRFRSAPVARPQRRQGWQRKRRVGCVPTSSGGGRARAHRRRGDKGCCPRRSRSRSRARAAHLRAVNFVIEAFLGRGVRCVPRPRFDPQAKGLVGEWGCARAHRHSHRLVPEYADELQEGHA